MASHPDATPPGESVVFLLDCDNTLLDNDGLKDDLNARLRALLGEQMAARFWQVYEAVRDEEGTVDLPLTFERFRADCRDEEMLASVRSAVMDYPFAERVFPATLPTLAYLRTLGMPAILSDGDSVYQPHKIEHSGLAEAVEWQVAIYIHKEQHIEEVMIRWPADFYVLVDDKAHILTAVKAMLPDRFVTVHVRQGHYSTARQEPPLPDVSIDHIDALRALTLADLRAHLRQ